MKRILAICSICLLALLGACSKDHTDLPTGFIYDPPSTPTNLQVGGGAERAALSWSYPEDEYDDVEFRIYYYVQVFDLLELIGTTSDSTYIDSLLVGNLVYCYSISAVDTTTGLEGWRTSTVCDTVYSK